MMDIQELVVPRSIPRIFDIMVEMVAGTPFRMARAVCFVRLLMLGNQWYVGIPAWLIRSAL
jgi:hypothetical protein